MLAASVQEKHEEEWLCRWQSAYEGPKGVTLLYAYICVCLCVCIGQCMYIYLLCITLL